MEVQKRSITVGVDGSEGGRRALAWAVRHAAAVGAQVDVVTAWSWDGTAFVPGALGGPYDAQAYAALRNHLDIEEVLGDLEQPHPTVIPRVVEGPAATVLAEAAKGSELLVVGSRGRGALASALLGSVSEGSARRAQTPVVIVPAPAEPTSWWVRPPRVPATQEMRTVDGVPLVSYVARSMGAP